MNTIRPAVFPQDSPAVLAIWRDYVASPSVSLSYQNFDAEFSDLPGKYAHPDGCILLAEVRGDVLGCISLRRVNPVICEMKRLYVRPSGRRLGLGRALVMQLIEEARAMGYQEMRLDVLPEFQSAQQLYADIGFVAAVPVSFNPIEGTQFLGLALAPR